MLLGPLGENHCFIELTQTGRYFIGSTFRRRLIGFHANASLRSVGDDERTDVRIFLRHVSVVPELCVSRLCVNQIVIN